VLIIFEGPDGCGKTNIAQGVSERLGVPVYKSGKEPELFYEPEGQYLSLKWANYEMIKLLEVTGTSVIFDRFFPSEWVYSQVFNRKTDLDLVKKYDKWWSSLNGIIIWLDKPTMDVEDELIPSSKYNEIRMKYFEYMQTTQCHLLYLDTTDHDLHAQVDSICDFIKETLK
jgi:thymidylate kinase